MTASGEVVHAEKMDKNEDIDQPFTTQPAPSGNSAQIEAGGGTCDKVLTVINNDPH